jgi:hypothetical protein
MPLGMRLLSAQGRRSGSFGLCALLSLIGCSVINHFDDVKPAAGGAASGTAGAGGTNGTGAGGSGTAGVSTAGAGGSVTADSGAEGSGGSGGTVGDSGFADVPTDMTVRTLTCRFVIGSPTGGHVQLDDYSSLPGMPGQQRTLSDKFFIMPLANTTSVRILVQLGGGSDTYNEYFASDGGMTGPGQTVAAHGRLVAAQKLNSRQTVALVIENGGFDPDAGSGTPSTPRLTLHTFDDSNFSATPTMAAMTNPGQLGTSGQIEAQFSPDLDGKIAIAASFELAAGRSRAGYALYTGAPVDLVPLLDDSNPDNVRPTALVHVRGTAGYAFVGQMPQSEFEIKDDPSMGMPTRRPIMGNAFALLANIDTGGLINIAAADIGTPLIPHLKLYVGQVDVTRAMTFDTSSFVLAKDATSLTEVPIGTLAGWSDDFLLFAGPTGANATELSILFLDVLGRTRAAQKLQDTQSPVSRGGITPRGVMGGVGGRYHIAWAETHQDPGGTKYDVLWYDQIECL